MTRTTLYETRCVRSAEKSSLSSTHSEHGVTTAQRLPTTLKCGTARPTMACELRLGSSTLRGRQAVCCALVLCAAAPGWRRPQPHHSKWCAVLKFAQWASCGRACADKGANSLWHSAALREASAPSALACPQPAHEQTAGTAYPRALSGSAVAHASAKRHATRRRKGNSISQSRASLLCAKHHSH